MRLLKLALLSSFIILLSGCEELGIDLSQLDTGQTEDTVRDATDGGRESLFETNIMLKGIDSIEVPLGEEFDLREGVIVEGLDFFELKIETDYDHKRPGGYVAKYMVIVDGEVVYEAERKIVVLEMKEADVEEKEDEIDEVVEEGEDGSVSEVRFIIYVVGSDIKEAICDGVDDDCDGIDTTDADLTRTGIIKVKRLDKATPLMIVNENDLVNESTMRIYMKRQLSSEELSAIDIAGNLATAMRALGNNPLYNGNNTEGTNPLYTGSERTGENPIYDPAFAELESWIGEITTEERKALTIIGDMYEEVVVRYVAYQTDMTIPEVEDELLVCLYDAGIRISIVEDTTEMRAKEKANRTKCSSNLRSYLDDDSDGDSIGVDDLAIDQLRSLNQELLTEEFSNLSISDIERILNRELTKAEAMSVNGVDDDCDGADDDYMVCGTTNHFVANVGNLEDAQRELMGIIDIKPFMTLEFDSYDETMKIYELTEEQMIQYTELVVMSVIREFEEGFGHDLSEENSKVISDSVRIKFKPGSDLSGKVNFRDVETFKGDEFASMRMLYDELRLYKPIHELVHQVFGPGDPIYGNITFRLGRDLSYEEEVALHYIPYIRDDYLDNGGREFYMAEIDVIQSLLQYELTEIDIKNIEIYQAVMQAQDYNSSRSNTTS